MSSLKNYEFFKQCASDYIVLGNYMGLFDKETGEKFKKGILDLQAVIDNTLPGDARIQENTLLVNMNKLKTKKFSRTVLYHEFTHYCNDIHRDLFVKNNSLIAKLKAYTEEEMCTDYDYGYITTKMGDVNNPYTYISWGGILMDEVISEYVATKMIEMQYQETEPLMLRQNRYGNEIIKYSSHFEYYGIGEQLMDKFAKTLFLPNDQKNTYGLCRESFKKGFVRNMIHQHYENDVAFSHLIEELAYFGVISFSEEQRKGHLLDRGRISPTLICDSYDKVNEILDYGRESRQTMPKDIPEPEFIK